ncbi:MAG: hypothetical protein JSR65_02565 [Proteobacteria bacterium]|nr:hypothetical protein [Pseudomonadota bacterium]
MKPKLADEVLHALHAADRKPGWNNRSADVRRFEIGRYGLECTLYVVPFRRWAYRRQELASAAYWQAQA